MPRRRQAPPRSQESSRTQTHPHSTTSTTPFTPEILSQVDVDPAPPAGVTSPSHSPPASVYHPQTRSPLSNDNPFTKHAPVRAHVAPPPSPSRPLEDISEVLEEVNCLVKSALVSVVDLSLRWASTKKQERWITFPTGWVADPISMSQGSGRSVRLESVRDDVAESKKEGKHAIPKTKLGRRISHENGMEAVHDLNKALEEVTVHIQRALHKIEQTMLAEPIVGWAKLHSNVDLRHDQSSSLHLLDNPAPQVLYDGQLPSEVLQKILDGFVGHEMLEPLSKFNDYFGEEVSDPNKGWQDFPKLLPDLSERLSHILLALYSLIPSEARAHDGIARRFSVASVQSGSGPTTSKPTKSVSTTAEGVNSDYSPYPPPEAKRPSTRTKNHKKKKKPQENTSNPASIIPLSKKKINAQAQKAIKAIDNFVTKLGSESAQKDFVYVGSDAIATSTFVTNLNNTLINIETALSNISQEPTDAWEISEQIVVRPKSGVLDLLGTLLSSTRRELEGLIANDAQSVEVEISKILHPLHLFTQAVNNEPTRIDPCAHFDGFPPELHATHAILDVLHLKYPPSRGSRQRPTGVAVLQDLDAKLQAAYMQVLIDKSVDPKVKESAIMYQNALQEKIHDIGCSGFVKNKFFSQAVTQSITESIEYMLGECQKEHRYLSKIDVVGINMFFLRILSLFQVLFYLLGLLRFGKWLSNENPALSIECPAFESTAEADVIQKVRLELLRTLTSDNKAGFLDQLLKVARTLNAADISEQLGHLTNLILYAIATTTHIALSVNAKHHTPELANGYATISRLICEIAPVIDDSPEKPTQVGGYVNRAGVRARRAIFNEIRINKDLENSADRSVKKIPSPIAFKGLTSLKNLDDPEEKRRKSDGQLLGSDESLWPWLEQFPATPASQEILSKIIKGCLIKLLDVIMKDPSVVQLAWIPSELKKINTLTLKIFDQLNEVTQLLHFWHYKTFMTDEADAPRVVVDYIDLPNTASLNALEKIRRDLWIPLLGHEGERIVNRLLLEVEQLLSSSVTEEWHQTFSNSWVLVNWALATVCRGPEIAFSVDRTYQPMLLEHSALTSCAALELAEKAHSIFPLDEAITSFNQTWDCLVLVEKQWLERHKKKVSKKVPHSLSKYLPRARNTVSYTRQKRHVGTTTP